MLDRANTPGLTCALTILNGGGTAVTWGTWEIVRIALVHDYLAQYGGAERVLEVLHRLYPDAPVFTSIADLSALPPHFGAWDIRESPLRYVPDAARLHRGFLAIYPAVFRGFARALREYDVVIADSSAWAHHATVASDAVLVCYCHSPARFLYGDADYLTPAHLPPAVRQLLPPILAGLRRLDRRAARRVDRYLANSQNVAARIRSAYGREATVVYPPVDVERFAANVGEVEPEPWFLVVSRLVPHKRVDLAVDAFTRLGLPLKVVGAGRSLGALRQRAGSSVEFLGWGDDDLVVNHLRRCRALVLPAAEDFGMTAVEAQAAGRPVIAYGKGGALESVLAGETGLFFGEPTPEALVAAVAEFERRDWEPARARENAARFGRDRFMAEIADAVEAAVAAKRGQGPGALGSPSF